MKVYVVKNEQGKYQTPDMSFISSIWQADLFNDYEVAKCYCRRDCEIVECDLMETTTLTDYTKQVRKEVVREIKKILLKQRQEIHNQIKDNSTDISYWTGHLDRLDVCEFEILDQIQGETNNS